MIKINWGVRIAVLYIGFIILVLAMVVFAMTKKSELVSDNYYAQELKFQEQIDKNNRTDELTEQVKIEYSGSFISIKFPDTYNKKEISGVINFYRPSDDSKDFKLKIELDENGEQKIITAKLLKGFWKLKLNWTMSGKEYYKEAGVIME